MHGETWTYEALFEGLDPSPSFVSECERLGLLRVVARDSAGRPLYGAEAKEQLEKVMDLMAMGYDTRDVAAIVRRVGLPRGRRRLFHRPPTLLRLEELSQRADVPEASIRRWQEAGVMFQVMTTERGDMLFQPTALSIIQHLQDLTTLGLDEAEIVAWGKCMVQLDAIAETGRGKSGRQKLAGWDAERRAAVETLLQETRGHLSAFRARIQRWHSGLRRWDKVVAVYERRVARIAGLVLSGGDGAHVGKRRGKRRRVTRRTISRTKV